MGLKHVVVTSVNRDELHDGGATLFAATIRWIRRLNPDCAVEVLTPTSKARATRCKMVMDARPDVFNHNVETVPRLYQRVRPQAVYERSLDVLSWAKEMRPETPTKTGFMLGLGETHDEVLDLLRDLRAHDVDIVTIGQYLRPTAATPAHRALRHARRVPRVRAHRPGDGLPPRRERPAGAQLLPCLGSTPGISGCGDTSGLIAGLLVSQDTSSSL